MTEVWKFPCQLMDNYDGDTLTLRLDLGFNVHIVQNVRLHGVDAPELRGGAEIVKQAGFLARDRVREFLADKSLVYCSVQWSGKYGRSLGDVEADGASLGQYLLENRLAVAYEDGNRVALLAQHKANAEGLKEQGQI